MSEYTYSEAASDFKKIFELANTSRTPIKIKNQEGKSIVVMSEADYNAIEETFYLLKNPYNAEHLISSVNEKSIKYQSLKDLSDETGI